MLDVARRRHVAVVVAAHVVLVTASGRLSTRGSSLDRKRDKDDTRRGVFTRARQHTLPRRRKQRSRVLRHANGDEFGSRGEKEITRGLSRVRRY